MCRTVHLHTSLTSPAGSECRARGRGRDADGSACYPPAELGAGSAPRVSGKSRAVGLGHHPRSSPRSTNQSSLSTPRRGTCGLVEGQRAVPPARRRRLCPGRANVLVHRLTSTESFSMAPTPPPPLLLTHLLIPPRPPRLLRRRSHRIGAVCSAHRRRPGVNVCSHGVNVCSHRRRPGGGGAAGWSVGVVAYPPRVRAPWSQARSWRGSEAGVRGGPRPSLCLPPLLLCLPLPPPLHLSLLD